MYYSFLGSFIRLYYFYLQKNECKIISLLWNLKLRYHSHIKTESIVQVFLLFIPEMTKMLETLCKQKKYFWNLFLIRVDLQLSWINSKVLQTGRCEEFVGSFLPESD
jgi:hypothetical protein